MSGSTRRRFLAGAGAAGSAVLLSRNAGAQGTPPVPLLPEPKGALQPGKRLCWFSSAASIAGERQQIEPDGNGGWVNKATGQRFRQFDTPSPGGAGFVVADVLAADASGFLLYVWQLLIHTDAGNATTFSDVNGLTASAAGIGDYWVAPETLAAMTDRQDAASSIAHVPYVLAGHTYRALRVQSRAGDGWSQTTFDLDTGLALVSTSTAQGGPVQTLSPDNRIVAGAGSTLLTYSQVAGVRQTSLPGPGATFPAAFRRLRAITYSGTHGVVMAGTPASMQVPPQPLQVRYEISGNAGSYLRARMSAGAAAVDRVVPAGVVGSLWMDPGFLARSGQAQTLDNDQLTGVRTLAVGRQGNLTILALQSGLARQTFGYDSQSGLLTQADLRQQIGPATDIVAVRLAGTE